MPNLDAINLESTKENFVLPTVKSLNFPYELPSSFDASLYNGGVFVSPDDNRILATFEWIFEDESVVGTPATTKAPVIEEEGETSTASPAAPTRPPTAAEETPVVLFSTLSGGYGVGGSITLQYRRDICNDGNVANVPFLLFSNIAAPSAPGPFLWITRRPNQRFRQIAQNDVYIPFDDTQDGSFTKSGTYILDFPDPDVAASEFIGGCFVVWCEPFSVYIGGGEIVVKQ